jgi:hypothetical protein
MIKVFVAILFTVHLFACNPNQQAPQNKMAQSQFPFACLASQSSCKVNTNSGIFSIEFSGNTEMGKIKTELPFEILLKFDPTTTNAKLISVNSYMEGKTMFMGKVPVFFKLPETSTDFIVAQTLLASCSEEIMTWRLWFNVEIEESGNIQQQDFFIDFDSQRL